MTFEEARAKVLAFRDERDWRQFHTPKDLAISICLEAAELLEDFQWTGSSTDVPPGKLANATEELADVLAYCIDLADVLGVDIPTIIGDKMDKNAAKYPVEKARGSAKKYDEL